MPSSSPLELGWIRERIASGRYQISEHVIRFLMAKHLTIPEIEEAIQTGEVVQVQSASHRVENVLIRSYGKGKTIFVRASKANFNWIVISMAYLAAAPPWAELAATLPYKGDPMENPFHHCFFCGGELKAITVGNFDYRLEGKLYVIKDTPAGLCLQCGEKYVTAETAKTINALIEKGHFSTTEVVQVMTYVKDTQRKSSTSIP